MKLNFKLNALYLIVILIIALILFYCLGPIVENLDTYQKNLENETGFFSGKYLLNGKPSTEQEIANYYTKLYGKQFASGWEKEQQNIQNPDMKTNYAVSQMNNNNDQNMQNRTYSIWKSGFDTGIREGEQIGMAQQKEKNLIFNTK